MANKVSNEYFLKLSEFIAQYLYEIPLHWHGKKAILEMKKANYPHWKQMEWIGFYFQFLCEDKLKGVFEIPGPEYKNVKFDGLYEIPWDFKAHALNTTSHQIIVNDREATSRAIKDYGCVGLILAVGEVKYNDENRNFQKWHEELKGGKSKYEMERIERGAWSRLRKIEFTLKQIVLIKIDEAQLNRCGSFQRNFRNSNGKPRREKVLLDLEKLDPNKVYIVDIRR